ncbi:hypothetical protein E8E14_014591 [Neopestalotiopsis sp. 37M]|nr:hypothetical protein E8E14_014591 [Neopestalotiopsis sp. 37M]
MSVTITTTATATATATASRTNLGPLTTAFAYPSSCNVAVLADCATCNYGWQAQTCSDNGFNAQGVQDNVDCWPARASSVSTGVALNGWGFYSPGIQCPSGYATSCIATEGVVGGFNFQFGLLPKTNSGSGSAFVLETFTVSAPLFQLNFQSSDLPATMTGSITISTDANTSSTSTPAETGSPAGEGLSTGAKAGIGAGVGVAAVALIGALLFFLLRRRKRTPTAELAAQSEPTEAPATEAPKQELPGQQPRHNVPAELQVNLVPSELPGNHPPGYG